MIVVFFYLINFIQRKFHIFDYLIDLLKIISKFNLPWNYEDSQYIIGLPYISNKAPDVENKVLNALKNREDLKKMVISNE